MKRFNDFMFTAARWKVAIISFIFGFCFINSLFLGLDYLFGSGIDMPLIKGTMLVSSILGLGLVGMILLFLKMSKESNEFWKKAEDVEKLIEDADSKEEMKIAAIELTKLYDMRMGRPHVYEVNRLVTIAKTKEKYLK